MSLDVEVIFDVLTVACVLLSFLFFNGITIIKKRIFDCYKSYSQNRKSRDIQKKPFRIFGPFAFTYFFKPLPSKKDNLAFYNDDRSKSLLSELNGYIKIIGYLLISSVVLLVIVWIHRY